MYSSTLVIPANILVADSSYNFSVVITSVSEWRYYFFYYCYSYLQENSRVSIVSVSPKYNPTDKIFLSGTIVADPSIGML